MTTRVAIDLNVRVAEGQTYAGFEDVEGSRPVDGETVHVYERESGIFGKATVTHVDDSRQLIYLAVDWSSLTDPAAVGGQIIGAVNFATFGAPTATPPSLNADRALSAQG